MTDKIVVVDFSGTLTQTFLAEEANKRRCSILGISPPEEAEHKKQHGTKSHYDILKNHIEKKFGISDDMKIGYVQNYGDEIELSGKDMKTVIMTELFKITNFEIAAEKRQEIFAPGILDALQKVKAKGFKLAIVSGTRTDIISGLLNITDCPVTFDFILGQDPVLSLDDSEKLLEELSKQGDITYIIGDKLSDLEPAKKYNAKSIFVKWGHPTGGEAEFADFSIDDAKEIENIIV